MLSLLSSPRSTNPTLIPCPYSNPLLFQLRSFFPLSHPFPVLASPVCQPSSQSPPQPPPAVLRFPVPWMPRTQPAARSQGRDILQFAVLCSPSFTAPHSWSRLRRLALGTSGWRAERKAFLGALPRGSPPAPRPQANVPQRAKVSPRPPACSSCVRLLPLPGKQPPPQALSGSFPRRPPTVFRSLGSGGPAWAPGGLLSLRPGSRPASGSYLGFGSRPQQPPPDALPPPVATPCPAPAVFTRGGRGGAGRARGLGQSEAEWVAEKGWQREEEAVRYWCGRVAVRSQRGPSLWLADLTRDGGVQDPGDQGGAASRFPEPRQGFNSFF